MYRFKILTIFSVLLLSCSQVLATDLSDGVHVCLHVQGSEPLLYGKNNKLLSFSSSLKQTKKKRIRLIQRLQQNKRSGKSSGQLKTKITSFRTLLSEIKKCKRGDYEGSGENDDNDSGGGDQDNDSDSPNSPGIPSNISPDEIPTTADYYVCNCLTGADSDCQSGSDSNAGTSASAAWQTFERARQHFSTMEAGKTLAFCQGGSFQVTSSSTWVNSSCQSAAPCVIRNYQPSWASGDEDLPLITNLSGGIFDLANGGYAVQQQGYTIRSLSLKGGNAGVGVFIFNDVDDVNLEYLEIDGFQIGVQVAGANLPATSGDGESSRIRLYGSRILNNSGQGWLGGCDDCVIDSSYFENNGFTGPTFYHNIYWGNSAKNATLNGVIKNNELYKSALQSGACSGVSLVVHGTHDDLLIESNYVREDVGTAAAGCWGISVDSAYNTQEGFRNLTIRGNKVENVGNLGIGCTSCSDTLIENNLIIDQRGNSTGIAVPNRTRGAEDEATQAVTVRNNTLHISGASATGIKIDTEGTGHVIANNAIYYDGVSNSWSCLNVGLSSASYDTVDNNLCYFPNSAGKWEANTGSLQVWQSDSGLDQSSLEADPAFTNSSSGNYMPASSSSPLVDAAKIGEAASHDIFGTTRQIPDIGAFEFVN